MRGIYTEMPLNWMIYSTFPEASISYLECVLSEITCFQHKCEPIWEKGALHAENKF